MTTSPYDTLPTGKQALAPTSGESIEEKPNPITDPYGGYEEISLEEAARLATPVISQSQDSGSSPAANRNSGDPVSAKTAASQPASAPGTAMKKMQPAASARTDTQFDDVNNTGNAGSSGTASGSASLSNAGSSGTASGFASLSNAGSSGAASSSASLSAESLLDAELHYDNIRLRNRRRTWNYTLPFDETLLVPDTMPDMIQILFSEGRVTPSQPGKTHYSSSDTYSGEILLFTVYRPDGDEGTPVDVVRSTISFETSACWGTSSAQNTSPSQADSDRIYYATVCLKKVEPSRLNERKFQVRGKLCIAVTEIQKTELHVLRDSSDKNLILKQEKKEAADLIFETEEFADIEQEIAVEEGQPQPVRILKESFTITETHRQISSGKLIINGLLQIQILYLGEDDERENQLCCRREKTEFTQFIPLQSQLNSDLIKVDFSGDGLKLAIENQDTFQLEGQVRIRIHGYGSKQIPVASDAYHKEKSIHFDRKVEALSCLTDVLSGEISAREVVNLTQQDQHPEKLICGSILPSNVSVHPEHGRIVIEGTVPVRILSLDENGRAFVIKSEVPLRGALNTSASPEALQEADLFTCSAIKDFWIDTINSRQIEINVNAIIEVWISENREFTTLEHFTARGEDPQQPAMAIYITSAGDSLWNVAKHYQCDADALVQLNQIDGDAPLTEGAKLLIVR
ncbi:MAG: DUF3794 domain-containing protein [Clostridia bacterium]|nr:DUF3794 domain-containing protein [Clostridia bacterium]